MSRREVVERLVREELGCTCPAEVFEHIEEGQAALPGLAEPGRRIAIGGRLLVYLIGVDGAEQALRQLPSWVAAGRAERDAAGMSRLRLVVITAEPGSLTKALGASFDALPERDERTHLHVLPRSAVGELFSHAAGFP